MLYIIIIIIISAIEQGTGYWRYINALLLLLLIEDAKVKELVYSGNTVIFSLPNRECTFSQPYNYHNKY